MTQQIPGPRVGVWAGCDVADAHDAGWRGKNCTRHYPALDPKSGRRSL